MDGTTGVRCLIYCHCPLTHNQYPAMPGCNLGGQGILGLRGGDYVSFIHRIVPASVNLLLRKGALG